MVFIINLIILIAITHTLGVLIFEWILKIRIYINNISV